MYYAAILLKIQTLFPGVNAADQIVMAHWMVDNITTLVDTTYFADEREQAMTDARLTIGAAATPVIPIYNGLTGTILDLFQQVQEYSLDLAIEANTPATGGGSTPYPTGTKFAQLVASQVAAGDPTAVSMPVAVGNGLGVPVSFSRTAAGQYVLTFGVGVFPTPSKVFVEITCLDPAITDPGVSWAMNVDNSSVNIDTFKSGVADDSVLTNSTINITVYP